LQAKLNSAGNQQMHKNQTAKPARNRDDEPSEILARITHWTGSEAQALTWYRTHPIPAFGGQTAEDLVKENQAAPLREYLDHLSMGGFA
jgi:hypothetical protein